LALLSYMESNYCKHHLNKQNSIVYTQVTIVTNYADVVSLKTDSRPIYQDV
jgi:hypothetical protein